MHIYLLRFMSKRKNQKLQGNRRLSYWIQRPYEIPHAQFILSR